MNARCVGILFVVVVYLFCCGAWAQTSQNSNCTLDVPSLATGSPNIFNDQQEQALGDALAEYFEPDLRLAAPEPDDQLTQIGERLLAALPATGVSFHFRMYESGEINAFSTAGGRVYVSRKLIAAAKSEDELAAVIGHEIGHLMTHQAAIYYTRLLKTKLGVTQVGDRADVFAKFHQMMNTPAKSPEEDNEEKGELAADRVGIYALVRAGYAAESASSFYDRVTTNRGKTGNWLSDTFGITHEASQRYRAALKLTAALPQPCKGRPLRANERYDAWRLKIVQERLKTEAENASGDRPVKLDPPMRTSLWRIRFSPDGRYLLAQDEGGISVLERDAHKVLFHIEAPDAARAQFTPDSQSVVFHDPSLRVERWSVATGKRTSVNEVVAFEGCEQSLLIPDGKTLVCVTLKGDAAGLHADLRLIDVESNKAFFEKPGFYKPGSYIDWTDLITLARNADRGNDIINLAASADGHYLVATAGASSLAYDLEHQQPVALGGKLKGLTQRRMGFLGDQLMVMGDYKGDKLFPIRGFSFPDGKIMQEGLIGDQQFEATTKGGLLIVWPLKDYEVGLLDSGKGTIVEASKHFAIDAFGKSIASETTMGGIALQETGGSEVQRIDLPPGQLPVPRSAVFSRDGRYLAVSVKSRAGIWDLETGKQIRLIRPFASAWMDGDDHLFAQCPKFREWDAQELELTMAPFASKALAKLDDDEWQYRDFEMRFKPMGKDKATRQHATLEVKKMQTQTVAWTRDYPHETPACWRAEDDRMVLAWDLGDESVKDEIKKYPNLEQEVLALKGKKKGLLIETVVPETGAALEQVIIPEADLTRGWNDVRRARVSGAFALAQGEHGNTVIYKLDSGEKVGEFFGRPLATDAAAGLIAAVNREDEILLVDEQTGKELKRFTLGSPVLAARIVVGKEKALLVLTADQVVHRLPVVK
jgi:hypothetical protein